MIGAFRLPYPAQPRQPDPPPPAQTINVTIGRAPRQGPGCLGVGCAGLLILLGFAWLFQACGGTASSAAAVPTIAATPTPAPVPPADQPLGSVAVAPAVADGYAHPYVCAALSAGRHSDWQGAADQWATAWAASDGAGIQGDDPAQGQPVDPQAAAAYSVLLFDAETLLFDAETLQPTAAALAVYQRDLTTYAPYVSGC